MKRIHLFCLSLFGVLSLTAQTTEKVVLDPRNPMTGYYLQVVPKSNNIEQVLLLMPGYTQLPESIFTESMLPYVAYNNNILTIAMAGGPSIFANKPTITPIEKMMENVKMDFPATKDVPWVIGGFSAGGTIALRYVEQCQETPDDCPVTFGAVFTVDSPVDIIDLWNYFDREIERNLSEAGVNEAKFVSNQMRQQEGTPKTQPERYTELSPIDIRAKSSNEVWLKAIPVRVYHDIDVNWLINERGRSIFEANFLNSSELIRRLRALGNEGAEFVQSDLTGKRSNGLRHPHSWSIVDAFECIQWIKSL